ncbi:MAG TPA: allantoinase AllB [Flavobacteriales bacterium]|nr:allantoinase AllB [Flavobacteriales bacterium]
MKRFAIHSNRTVMPHGTFEATVVIEDQKILMVIDGLADGLDCEYIDAADHVLMPGLIDPHVHINEPGRTDWEGFDTGTRAAAAGGITTIVDMPLNSSPVTTTVEAFDKKLKASEGKLHVNCGFWGGIVPENAGQLKELLGSGVLGIKAFLIDSGLDEFKNVEERHLREGIPAITESGLRLLAHSELIKSEQNDIAITDYPSFLQSRPKQWEDDAINLLIQLTAEYNCKTHIVHLSSSGSLEQIRKAKEKGLSLTVETCPHYLVFNAEDIPPNDPFYKCAPPIRERANNEKLWEAIRSGLIDFVASDHSPAPPDLKEIESGNYQKAWGGIVGLQFLLPAFWTGAKARGLTINKLAELMCENPSKFLGLEAAKGRISPGYDADLVIWAPEEKVIVSDSSIQHKHKGTPYASLNMVGLVKKTFVSGKLVYDNGEFVSLSAGKAILRNEY